MVSHREARHVADLRRLQLGHVLSNMVSPNANVTAAKLSALQLGHVLSNMVSIAGQFVDEGVDEGFNWAMSFQTW